MKYKYLLRIGLAFVFLFAGIDALWHPGVWIGYVPLWISNFGLSTAQALQAHGIFEVVLGLMLLFGKWLRVVAGLAALDMLAVLFLNGISYGLLLTTFRDVSIFFTAAYLALDRN